MLALVVAVVIAAFWTLVAVAVLRSVLGGFAADPHGYTKVFGSLMLVPGALVGAVALALVGRGPAGTWRWPWWVSIAWVVLALVLTALGLFVEGPTAPPGVVVE